MKKKKKSKERSKEEKWVEGKWIQAAIGKPGTLHKALGVPLDKKIPASKLKIKKGDSAKMKRRKNLAKTLKKITARRKKKKNKGRRKGWKQ